MTRKRRHVPCSIEIEITTVQLEHLRQLVETGLHGLTVEQCAEELLREQLRKVLLARREAGLETGL